MADVARRKEHAQGEVKACRAEPSLTSAFGSDCPNAPPGPAQPAPRVNGVVVRARSARLPLPAKYGAARGSFGIISRVSCRMNEFGIRDCVTRFPKVGRATAGPGRAGPGRAEPSRASPFPNSLLTSGSARFGVKATEFYFLCRLLIFTRRQAGRRQKGEKRKMKQK